MGYSAETWMVEAAWVIAKGTPLADAIPRSQAMSMLRQSGDWDLIEAMRGPVAKACYNDSLGALARYIFATKGKLRDKYDVGTFGEITRAEAVERINKDGPATISGKEWADMKARVTALETLLKEK